MRAIRSLWSSASGIPWQIGLKNFRNSPRKKFRAKPRGARKGTVRIWASGFRRAARPAIVAIRL